MKTPESRCEPKCLSDTSRWPPPTPPFIPSPLSFSPPSFSPRRLPIWSWICFCLRRLISAAAEPLVSPSSSSSSHLCPCFYLSLLTARPSCIHTLLPPSLSCLFCFTASGPTSSCGELLLVPLAGFVTWELDAAPFHQESECFFFVLPKKNCSAAVK